ncbi:zinc ribbon domain-containing protein [Gudongella oleilytica]|uniref:zinc ribbon domain-containing protein n=1 Tax=Gudongella oleilytica TaxID=1582259 RepID=UPI002A35E225|nr:zinc ribbon domain-containing protein [Gudongella oleilytica]MDY0257993.1 zinc ribbon domain-containing protein [Gudongella oleilytica]
MSKFCGSCGAPLDIDDKFCGSCGSKIEGNKQMIDMSKDKAVRLSKPEKKPRKRGMFSLLALIVVFALGIGSIPGILGEDKIKPVKVQRGPEPLAAQTSSEASAIALKQYIYARIKTEEFEKAVLDKASIPELKIISESTARAWEDAMVYASVAEEINIQAIEVLESKIISRTKILNAFQSQLMFTAAAPVRYQTFTLTPIVPKEIDPKTWAESLTKKFDSTKGARRYNQLAQQLGTDAKAAYEQMQLAQQIINNEATEDAAFWDKLTQAAQVTKTACKVGLLGISMIGTGGGSVALLEGAGLLVGGVDCIVDVAETGSTIILGDGNQVAVAFGDIKEKMGPVSSLVGLVTLNPSGIGKAAKDTTEALVYVSDSLVDLFFEDKVMGIKVEGVSNHVISITSEVVRAGTEETLRDIGLKWPLDNDVKAIADILMGWKPDKDVTVARLDALAQQSAAIYENPELYNNTADSGLEKIPEEELEEWEAALADREVDSTDTDAPVTATDKSSSNISGTYTCDISGQFINESLSITIKDNGDGTAVVTNFDLWDMGSERLPARYNSDTGRFSFDMFDAVFTKTGGVFTASGELYIEGQKHIVSLY